MFSSLHDPALLATSRRHLPILILIWLVAVSVAAFFALLLRDVAVLGDVYLPLTNDSFYHARRILDAVAGERGFYQFDDRLQVPEGTWIPWPWAYDYLIAKVTQMALWLRPSTDPMAFIAHIPVVWIAANAALFLGACSALGLSLGMRAIAMLAFALSPLVQLQHSIGMIDHHYIEHSFVLANIWLGMVWLRRPDSRWRAAALGIVLGIAPAFHTGLFILQLVAIGTIFVLWLRGATPLKEEVTVFAASLIASTQLILLPSAPYLNGMFEFGLLSWFHFYVAVATSIAVVYMAWRPRTGRALLGLGLTAALLAVPIVAPAFQGLSFLSADFSILETIEEAKSPYELSTGSMGSGGVLGYYSWLLLVAPLLLLFHAYRLFRETSAERLYFSFAAVLGLTLLLTQFRFYYYGLFALISGTLLITDQLRSRNNWHGGLVFVATLGLITLAYQPALRERLFTVYAPGADPAYASTLSLLLDLERLCMEDPGVVLASNDDGNAILFHTDCSVIANNFILRQQDEEKIAEVTELMGREPEFIRRTRPDIRYMLLRAGDFSVVRDDAVVVAAGNPIARQLLLDENPPEGFQLVREIKRRASEDAPARLHARLYRITRLPSAR